MRTIYSIAALFLLCAFTGNTSWEGIDRKAYDKIMARCDSFYRAQKNYEVYITHASYRGHDALAPYETSFGKSIVMGENSYHGVLGIHTIQTPKFKIIIDSTSKLLFLENNSTAKANDLPSFAELNVQQYMTGYKKAQRNNQLLLHVDYSSGPSYEAHELHLSPQGRIEQVTVYYRKAHSIDPQNPNAPKVKPKLVVKYDRFSTKVNPPSTLFTASTYFRENKGGATPAPAYNGWEFHDLRIKK